MNVDPLPAGSPPNLPPWPDDVLTIEQARPVPPSSLTSLVDPVKTARRYGRSFLEADSVSSRDFNLSPDLSPWRREGSSPSRPYLIALSEG